MSGASYVGKAPLTLVKTASSTAYVYAGQPVPTSADPGDVARLVADGYLIEAEAETTEATSPTTVTTPAIKSDEKPLDKMTKAELEAVATAEGVDLSGASNNDKRVAAIEAARAAKAAQPAPATDEKPLGEMSVDELKEFAAEHELDVAGVADGDLLIHIEKELDEAETADNATASTSSTTTEE